MIDWNKKLTELLCTKCTQFFCEFKIAESPRYCDTFYSIQLMLQEVESKLTQSDNTIIQLEKDKEYIREEHNKLIDKLTQSEERIKELESEIVTLKEMK